MRIASIRLRETLNDFMQLHQLIVFYMTDQFMNRFFGDHFAFLCARIER
jgi:hypothetical protein